MGEGLISVLALFHLLKKVPQALIPAKGGLLALLRNGKSHKAPEDPPYFSSFGSQQKYGLPPFNRMV